jgi:hypothetical protein
MYRVPTRTADMDLDDSALVRAHSRSIGEGHVSPIEDTITSLSRKRAKIARGKHARGRGAVYRHKFVSSDQA